MSRSGCCAVAGGIGLAVQIIPNARKTEVIGVLDGALKLRLQAQPTEGKANEALVKFLAKALGVPRSALTITHGLTSRNKLIEVISETLTPEQAAQRLVPLAACRPAG